MSAMKAIRIHSFGGPEVLSLDEIERPTPRQGEVLVKVLAASVNPVDGKIRDGAYPRITQTDLPVILGRDICGEIVETGDGVAHFKVGDQVYAFLDWARGGYEEYVIVKNSELAMKPRTLDSTTAAGVPLAGMTAWQGLFDHGGVVAGQRVLVHGGAGGVGHFAIQFAKARGAWVATTVSGADKDFARDLGADAMIDYKEERFEEMLEPVDMVFDLISGDTRERSFSVLKPGGIMVSTLGEPDKKKADQFGIRVAGYMAKPNGRQLTEIGELIDSGKVKVAIQKIFPLSQAANAQRMLEEDHNRGKIILQVMR